MVAAKAAGRRGLPRRERRETEGVLEIIIKRGCKDGKYSLNGRKRRDRCLCSEVYMDTAGWKVKLVANNKKKKTERRKRKDDGQRVGEGWRRRRRGGRGR